MIITIVTHRENKPLLVQCLLSLIKCKYPVVVVVNDAENTPPGDIKWYTDLKVKTILNMNDGFELGALKAAMEANPEEEDFFLMQDSCKVLDLKLFDVVAENPNSVSMSNEYLSYLGKYQRKIVNLVPIPPVKTKKESIWNESHWNKDYIKACKGNYTILDPMFGNSWYQGNEYKMIFGKERQVSINEYLIKYKAVYNAAKAKEVLNGN